MGKGSPPPPSSTVTQSNLPDYVKPQFERLLTKAEAESDRPYQLYTGQRRTGLTGGQQQALSMAENVARGGVGASEQALASDRLAGAASFDPGSVGYGYNPERALQGTQYAPGTIASSYTAGAGPGAFQAGQISGAYDPSQISSQYQAQALAPTYQAGTIASSYDPQASDFESRAFTDPGVASQYMNPFVENVIDRQSAKMRQQFQETQAPQMASQAVQSGAFGGSRAAIQRGLAREKLEDRIADFQAQQRLQGFQQGQQAFQQDRARALQAQQMRDQAARAAGQMGLSAQEIQERARAQAGQMGLTAQEASERARQQQAQMGLTAQQAMAQEQRAAAQLGLTGQQAQEEARARAAQLGLSGYEAAEKARAQQAQLGIAGQTAQEQARQQAAKQALAAQDAARQAYAQQAQIGLQSGQLGLSGAQQRAAAAAQLGQQGDRRQAFEARRADIMRQAAGVRQQDQQQALDLAYSDFLNQRDFPRQQLGFMSGILRGVPVSPTMETTKWAAQPNPLQQMMGFGLGGMGLMRSLGR